MHRKVVGFVCGGVVIGYFVTLAFHPGSAIGSAVRETVPFLHSGRAADPRFEVYFRVDRESPAIIELGNQELRDLLADPTQGLRAQDVAVAEAVVFTGTTGLWAPTRRSRNTWLEFGWHSSRPEHEMTMPLAEAMRRDALAHIRATGHSAVARIPPAIDSAPIEDLIFRVRATDTVIHWPGYVHNAISAGALGGLIWSLWPRRKHAASPSTTRAPDDGPRPVG